MVDEYCILWPWVFIDGGGEGEHWILYACLLCFAEEVMGWEWDIIFIMYSMWG